MQETIAKSVNATIQHCSAGHMVMLSQPETVAKLAEEIAGSL